MSPENSSYSKQIATSTSFESKTLTPAHLSSYSNESKGSIRIFARSVIKHENPAIKPTEEETRKSSQKPWFVYLQGGPGFGCRPPQDSPITNVVLDKGYQMLYIDQRGTGLSNPISAGTLALQGDAQRQADYLKHFRADNIVRDCEAIRKILTADYPEELKKCVVFFFLYSEIRFPIFLGSQKHSLLPVPSQDFASRHRRSSFSVPLIPCY